MISLFDYIIESLINAKELEKDLKFIESSKKEIYNILDTDDYKHGDVLGMSSDDLQGKGSTQLFLEKETTFYKIQYQENIIGIFGVVFPKQFENLYNTSKNYYYVCRKIFSLLGLNSISGLYKNVDIFNLKESDFEDKLVYQQLKENSRERQINELGEQLLFQSAYITVWAINQNVKKKLDINNFSLIKIFFNNLVKLCLDNGAQYMWANGKDEHITKMYVKVGQFINPYDELFKINIEKGFFGGNDENKDYYKTFTQYLVIKSISNKNQKIDISQSKDYSKQLDDMSKELKKIKVSLDKELKDIKDIANELNIPEHYVKLIKNGMTRGYIELSGDNNKYGISKENILKVVDDKEIVQKIIQKLKDSGYTFKYENDKEFERNGYKNPLAD